MKTKSTTILLVAVITFLFTVGIFSYVLIQINQQGKQVEESKKIISEHLAKEASYNKVQSLLNSTKEDRVKISNLFIEEKDVISFVSDIENNAAKLGIKLQTNNLSIEPAVMKDGVLDTPATLIVGFNFGGDEMSVRNFMLLLENLPYDKKIPTLSLVKDNDSLWKAATVIKITMKYD